MFEEAWKSIVRPPQIKTKYVSLGPKHRIIQNKNINRIDLTVMNRNSKKMEGFIFYSPDIESQYTILYLHGNGGNKLQALPFVQLIPSFGFKIAAFDFLGCGNSDPQVLSYGVNQVFDIKDMLEQIRKYIKIDRIIIWGRSMGSVCAMMFANMYPYEVSGLVLDSPFRHLSNVVQNIAESKVKLPLFVLKPVLYLIEQRANQEVGHDIFSIDYLSILEKIDISLPILFIFSNYDSLVPAKQVFQFYNSYKGPKDLYEIYHSHNDDRPQQLYKQGIMWITRVNQKLMKTSRFMESKSQKNIKISQKRNIDFEGHNIKHQCW